ncbi:MAG TPA: bifunctional phosphopantothenoylcysteine decarboxylase/phosphopantothenate--cysteine ligase CoaBC [Syntrophothermus lipocalidus]|uniref:Coenzyme A biosynthesis bifunctional protein CoaBC n=1 Tax=Syntrophothermus lipocalidus (strain DSM 12680 / TGB-C1) TaxID=643648 RepID=D7CLQ1_SYNLT|nr:bifunctional phosphopantothenoylcysteine decarboxylase/phosphopantothenate--cysteine ligase CoaBC [Syntrophothermus lipocalidus]ADI01636.1 phosphopantothenoylcysteine decarboxylase/phosphopantothenate/cysteine ligase [Syntrophothermus lipocalidus DSM 12680]HHV77033.1 bifunctional phosphopantothenoylcysteine decarboxylase/phosphopantothenate--cysteine ligase CoaBC [Syntrophothermus lipocalidus]
MEFNKTVGIGVSGGIAAYKTADLVSRLAKAGADVHVIMTRNATRFVTPLTFRTLSGNPVLVDSFEENNRWKVQHIGVAEEIDVLVICPATANIIGKMAHGLADDLLSTVVLATRAPILVVPAMNTNMYANRIVQDNLQRLREYGFHVLEPEEGELACGAKGKGRLPDIEGIYHKIMSLLNPRLDFAGKTVLVTSGPTREAIDPVRFISNRSTGKMGHALARAALARGAKVILVSGPTDLPVPLGVEYVPVTSAEEMYRRVRDYYRDCDVVIGAAAVADYRPRQFSQQKLKKGDSDLVIELTRNPDILAELGKDKGNRILVGFAAETQDLIANAVDKMHKKNLDLLVANDVTLEGAGFGTDTNIVTIISRQGDTTPLPGMAKSDLANVILDRISELF